MPGGVCARGGVCQRGRVCQRGVCQRGCVQEGGVRVGVCQRGVCQGGVCRGVVCHHALRQTPPVNRMIDRCKNITLPQTSFAGGKNKRANKKNLIGLRFDLRCCESLKSYYFILNIYQTSLNLRQSLITALEISKIDY